MVECQLPKLDVAGSTPVSRSVSLPGVYLRFQNRQRFFPGSVSWVLLFLMFTLAACGTSRSLTEKDLQQKAVENYLSGKDYLEQGDPESALDRFRVAQSLDPALEINRIAIGLTLLSLDRFAEAGVIFTDLMDGQSNRPAVALGLARAQYGLSRYGLALAAARLALELDPVSFDAQALIVRSLSRLDAHDEALAALDQLVESDFADPRLHSLKATVLARREAWAAKKASPVGKIEGSNGITRQDLAFLFTDFFPKFMLAAGAQKDAAPKDLPAQEPYANACRAAINSGLLEVLPDGTFRPEFVITRGDFAIHVSRFITTYLDDPNLELQYVGQQGTPFADLPNHHWAFAAVTLVTNLGIMQGRADGTFGLVDRMSGEAALMSFSMLNDYLEKCKTSDAGNPIKED